MSRSDSSQFEDAGEFLESVHIAIEIDDYERRGAPGQSVEAALTIRDIWLGDEIDEAHRRGDVTAISNIGQAAFIKLSFATQSHEFIRRSAAFRQANQLLVMHALQQR